MHARQVPYCAIAAFALVLPLTALSVGALGKEAKEAKKGEPTPWTEPVPRAECGPNDHVESGLQGQTTLAERLSGDSMRAYTCNLELVGQFQGEGSKYMMDWFGDCAYYGTTIDPEQQHPGVVVVDASDPEHPVATAYLDTPAMLDPHESLKVNQERKLLAGVQNNGPGFAIYDLSADCRHPVLKASIPIRIMDAVVEPLEEEHDAAGHAGNFTPDGLTYYGTDISARASIYAIDVTDPANPTYLGAFSHNSHDTYFSEDGTTAYLTPLGNTLRFTGPNGLVILDVSDIQFRRPNPQTRVISTLYWEDGSTAQQALPVTYRGRPHLIHTDEGGSGQRFSPRPADVAAACARGLPPHGFARIIDISDETNPRIVSKLMLEVSDPANCPSVLTDPPANNYSSHYCNVDKADNPKMVACTWRDGGLRVFDIRDPFRPREVAYYKPPARRTAFLPGSNLYSPGADRTVDHTPTQVRWRKHKGETHLWFASQDNGFQIVRFTKPMHELLGREKETEP